MLQPVLATDTDSGTNIRFRSMGVMISKHYETATCEIADKLLQTFNM
jgi:hypothetical protein